MKSRKATTARSGSATLDPTTMPCGPDRIEVEALHLSITQQWDSGSSQNVHLMENGDLDVILARGQQGNEAAWGIASDALTGRVIVSLGIDGDHDEVHYTHRGSEVDAEELLGQAIETLVACRYSLIQIRQANGGAGSDRNAFELGRDYERGLGTA